MRDELTRRSAFWRSLLGSLAGALDGPRRAGRRSRVGQHAAAERSADLLVSCLSAAQRAEFQRTRAFTVRGPSGRRYRIGFGTMANIEVLGKSGEVDYRLCAGPVELPTHAVMLAQKLMLESCEAEFLRIAARHPGLALPRGWDNPRF